MGDNSRYGDMEAYHPLGGLMKRLYYWFWHDLLRLPKTISAMLVDNIVAHEVAWTFVGAVVLSSGWAVMIHLIATR